MKLNKKIIAILGFSAVVGLTAMTLQPGQPGQPGQPREEPKLKNIKVLSKKLTYRQVDHLMDEWAHSLGVRCTFCHAMDPATNHPDFASDAKPEKEMAREMFKMESEINKKYFKATKDSLDMMTETGINCYTCHNGKAHPEVVSAPAPQRRQGPPGGFTPAGGMPQPPVGNPPSGTPPTGTPPAGSTPPAHGK